MLKYEHIKPGQRIRAHDFEPCPGRPDRFVEGHVSRHYENQDGTKFLVMVCDNDSGSIHLPTQDFEGNRVGKEILVPMETWLDWDGRIEIK